MQGSMAHKVTTQANKFAPWMAVWSEKCYAVDRSSWHAEDLETEDTVTSVFTPDEQLATVGQANCNVTIDAV